MQSYTAHHFLWPYVMMPLHGFPLNNLQIRFLYQPEPKSTETCLIPDYQLEFKAWKHQSREETNKPELHLNLVKRRGLLVKQSRFEITTLKTETDIKCAISTTFWNYYLTNLILMFCLNTDHVKLLYMKQISHRYTLSLPHVFWY